MFFYLVQMLLSIIISCIRRLWYDTRRTSLCEFKTWLNKAYNRDLMNDTEFKTFENELNKISIKLNNYINSIGKK
jgi:hypothetical protein